MSNDAKELTKQYEKFTRQLDFAYRVLVTLASDDLGISSYEGSSFYEIDRKSVEYALVELLGAPEDNQELNKIELEFTKANRMLINSLKEQIIENKSEVQEFIIQTDRMQLYYGLLTQKDFPHSPYGKALIKVLEKYGGNYPRITPSEYDDLCESVAGKTNSRKFYKQILKGKV